jgi:prepilin-type N-terminal cleavage/methylation domain-containing protein
MKKIFFKKNKSLGKNNGFTLIELLLYLGIFSIFLLITLQMFSSIFNIQLESEATSSAGTDGKYIVQRFTYDVTRASSISDPTVDGTPSSSLSLLVDGQNLIYRLNSGNLILENETTGTIDQLNSIESTVSNLSFLKLDGGDKDTIQISFTLTSVVKRIGGKEVRDFQTSVGIR